MSREVPLKEVSSLLAEVQVIRPRIGKEQRSCLGKSAEAIDYLGLPQRFADAYKAVDEVRFFPLTRNISYRIRDRQVPMQNAVEIGLSEFGSHVVNCDSGHVVYIDSSGTTQFINTSVERFLYFVGRFNQSRNKQFNDADELYAEAKQVDEDALSDPEGMWSVMIEEAKAGLY